MRKKSKLLFYLDVSSIISYTFLAIIVENQIVKNLLLLFIGFNLLSMYFEYHPKKKDSDDKD